MQVKAIFESVKAGLPANAPLPQFAGQALLMKGLLRRIERSWDSLQVGQQGPSLLTNCPPAGLGKFINVCALWG